MPIFPWSRGVLAAALGSLFVCLGSPGLEAAPIIWSAATGITGDGDVSTNGTLVGAFNLGQAGAGNTTVNGVTFAEFVVPQFSPSVSVGRFTFAAPGATLDANNLVGAPVAPFDDLTPAYQTLLGSIAGNLNREEAITLTITGLTVGQAYEFQWWASVSDRVFPDSSTATAGNMVTLDWNTTDAVGGIGQFSIGFFIADSVNQVITFGSDDNQPILNGFQLRQIGDAPAPIPEPGAVLVWTLTFGALGAYRVGRRWCLGRQPL